MKEIAICIIALLVLAAFVVVGAFAFVALTLWVEKHSDDIDLDDDYIDIDE